MISLIPLAFAAALQPPQIIALIVLLQTKRGAANGSAYIAGIIAFRLALGISFWMLVSGVESSVESSGGRFAILVGAVLMVLGLLMLVYALRRAFSAPDEDQATASWLDTLQEVTPARAALAGVAFLALDPKDWITDMATINLIADADLSSYSSLLIYLVYLLLAHSLLLLPLILVLVAPQQARRPLGNLNAWLKRHDRSIEIVVAVIFGLLFFSIGLERLGLI